MPDGLDAEMEALVGPYEPPSAGEPYVQISRVGRWTYSVSVVHGICRWGPDGGAWHVLGRKRAERKAAKALRAYVRYQKRNADTWEVHPDA